MMQLSSLLRTASAVTATRGTGTVIAKHCCSRQKLMLLQHQQQQQQQQRRPLFSSVRSIVRNVFAGDDRVNPKKLLERRYLYYALLALRFRDLRLQQQQSQTSSSSTDTTTNDSDADDDDALYERAIQELDAEELDGMRNSRLRQEVQLALQPQVLEILSAFRQVDAELGIGRIGGARQQQQQQPEDDDDDDERSPFRGWDWEPFVSILNDEYSKTCSDLLQQQQHPLGDDDDAESSGSSNEKKNKTDNDSATKRRIAFLERKRGALETLLSFHETGQLFNNNEDADTDATATATTSRHEEDAFGVDVQNTEPRSLELIRQYQTVNLVRSARVRDKLGYSVVCLRSTIPGAGRGLFVDGRATAGSLLAFLPGEIWPKEHLLTKSMDVVAHFEDDDDDCQVTLRFDDIVVDSRPSPVTVLTREGSLNPWALGHMVNHPTPGALPNCQSTMLNYTQQMRLGDLIRYVPNAYARKPGWQSLYFDAEATLMHGMGILARRDVGREELVYDYRLQSDETPDWYSPVQYGDGSHMMDEEQVVFFRDDWMNK